MHSIIFVFIVAVPVSLLLLTGFTVLQVFLCLRKSLWPGLVLPAINLLTVLALATGTMLSAGGGKPLPEGTAYLASSFSLLGLLALFAAVSLLVNLITCLICRRNLRRRASRELQRMSIQDLG